MRKAELHSELLCKRFFSAVSVEQTSKEIRPEPCCVFDTECVADRHSDCLEVVVASLRHDLEVLEPVVAVSGRGMNHRKACAS